MDGGPRQCTIAGGGGTVQSPLLILWAAVIVFALTNYMQRGELLRRLDRAERRLALLCRHTAFDQEAALRAEIRALAQEGRRQEAARLYRQETGATHVESARAVTAIESGRAPDEL